MFGEDLPSSMNCGIQILFVCILGLTITVPFSYGCDVAISEVSDAVWKY